MRSEGRDDSVANFEFQVNRLNPDAENIRDRNQGYVVARDEDGTEVGYLSFGTDHEPNVLALTEIRREKRVQGRGCGVGLIDALRGAYPGVTLVNGFDSNTREGDEFLAKMRARGKVR